MAKIGKYLSLISIEPTMILYMMAFMTTSVVEQEFYFKRACLVNANFSEDICSNLSMAANQEAMKKTKQIISDFLLWNGLASQGFAIIIAMFIGAWSDKRGRKLPLIMGLVGKLYYMLALAIISLHDHYSVMNVIYFASLPSTLTGSDIAIFASCFTYIADITSEESRTLRITILNACYLLTMPIGVSLGSYLFNEVFRKSFTVMFLINAAMVTTSLIYSLWRLKWLTSPKQVSILQCETSYLQDFFNKKHFINTFKVLFVKRKFGANVILQILLISTFLYTFQRDEKKITFLYLKTKFAWTLADFSNLKTFQSVFQVLIMITGIPVMSKYLKIKDTLIIMLASGFHCVAKVVFILANSKIHFYIASLIQCPGPIVLPVIRSILSKIVEVHERGKIFALLSVMENATVLVSSPLYSNVFKWSDVHPESFYWITFATQFSLLLLTSFVHFKYFGYTSERNIENSKL